MTPQLWRVKQLRPKTRLLCAADLQLVTHVWAPVAPKIKHVNVKSNRAPARRLELKAGIRFNTQVKVVIDALVVEFVGRGIWRNW